MGAHLSRWSLQSLRNAGDLVAVKLYTQTLEAKFRDPASADAG